MASSWAGKSTPELRKALKEQELIWKTKRKRTAAMRMNEIKHELRERGENP